MFCTVPPGQHGDTTHTGRPTAETRPSTGSVSSCDAKFPAPDWTPPSSCSYLTTKLPSQYPIYRRGLEGNTRGCGGDETPRADTSFRLPYTRLSREECSGEPRALGRGSPTTKAAGGSSAHVSIARPVRARGSERSAIRRPTLRPELDSSWQRGSAHRTDRAGTQRPRSRFPRPDCGLGPWEAAPQGHPPGWLGRKPQCMLSGRQSLGPAADRPPLWGPCPREDGPARGSSRPDGVLKRSSTCSLKF